MPPISNPLAELRRQFLDQRPVRLKPHGASPRLDRSPLVHLVEDDPVQAERLSRALRDDGYRVRVFTNPAELRAVCAAADAERPAAVVMDMIFPEGDDAGAELLAELKANQARCPPVVFVSLRDDMQARLAAFRAGACRYLVKPVETGRLIDLLDALTDRQPPQAYRVLMVDDDPLSLETHAAMLRAAGMEVQTLSQPLRMLDVLNGFDPDVVVLDVCMPEASGPELAAVLRERDAYSQLPILFLSAEADMSQQLLALNLGGDDFLVKPVQPDHLVSAVTARARRARQNSLIRQRLQTTLYEREREHLALDQHAIVSIADVAGNITYVNGKFCEISGYSRDELIGQNHRIIKSGDHPPAFYQDLWHTIAGGKVWEGEVCNRRKDGSLYWVESSITPFLDGDGIPYQYVSIRTDISRVKESEAALRAIVEGTSSVTGDHFFNAAVEGLARSMGARIGFISENDPSDANKLRTIAYWDADHIGENFSYDLANTPCEKVIQDGLCVYPEGVADLFPRDAWLQENGIESYIAICLHDSGGAFLGNMGVMDGRPMHDTAGKIDRLRIFAARVAGEAERRDSEAALRASESRLNFLVSSSPVTIYTCEAVPPYGATYVSPNVAQLMGLRPEQFTDNPGFWADNIHPEDRQRVLDDLTPLGMHGVHQHEYRFRMNDGSYRWLHDELRLVRDEAGEPVKIVGYWMDITARRRAEQAAEAHKERLRRGQLFANIGTWDWHIQTGELFWTERIAPLFGYPVGELETAYDNFLAAIHPDDRQAVIDAVTACVERDVPYEIEHRVVWPDGTVRWLLERGAVARDADGRPLQMLGVVQDIDDRKRAELALAERERQLREAQTLAHIGNWAADFASGRLSWSDEIYRIFGHAPGSFEPSVEAFHATVHPDDRARVHESEKRAEQTGRHDVVHRIVRPDGSVRHVHELAQMETDAAGNRVRLTGTVQDVTERVEVEQALIALSEEAERANRAKSDFLSSMSHELRTPMNAILGFGQLMEYDAALPEEHQDNVQEILRAGRHLLDLINEVLDLAKVESGHIDLSLEPVEVCPIVEECLSLVGPLADQRDIRLSHKGLKGAAVRADRTRLKQALLNLLSNAIKYNRDAGSVRIEVQLEGADRLRIRVSDTGPGIPVAHLAELFQPFNRLVAEHSDIEGTGIGLTITRRIVEMMGGSVDVESEVGVGSTFWIELPLESAPGPARAHAGAAADGAVPVPHIEAAQHTVLCIEDNPANIRLVAQILGRRKHITLLTAHTPELGIELALARRPELILLDINLPGMDGYQVLEVLKADVRLKAIPVVAITANAMSRDIERGRAAGFADYLTKPLEVERFYAVIDRLLGTGTTDKGPA